MSDREEEEAEEDPWMGNLPDDFKITLTLGQIRGAIKKHDRDIGYWTGYGVGLLAGSLERVIKEDLNI